MTKQDIQERIEEIIKHNSSCKAVRVYVLDCDCNRNQEIEKIITLISDVVKEVIGKNELNPEEGLSEEDEK